MEERIREESVAPAREIVKSSAAAPEVTVIVEVALVSKSNPPVVALIRMALVTSSFELMKIEEPKAKMSMSSPADAPRAVMSMPPIVAMMSTASATFSVEVILIEELEPGCRRPRLPMLR